MHRPVAGQPEEALLPTEFELLLEQVEQEDGCIRLNPHIQAERVRDQDTDRTDSVDVSGCSVRYEDLAHILMEN